MGYQPKMKKGAGFGPQGIAKVEVHPTDKNQIRYTLKVEKKNKDTGQVEVEMKKGQVSRSDCPDDLQKVIQPGVWFIAINTEGSKIYGFRPVDGVFEVNVTEFSHKENELPTPKTFQGSGDNGPYAYQYFTVILKIVSPEASGMKVPLTLRYHFDKEFEPGPNGQEREVVAYSHPRSKYTPLLIDFMDASGAWEKGPMPWKENLLPMIEKRIKEQGKVFKVVVQKGQVQSILGGHAEFAADFAAVVEE